MVPPELSNFFMASTGAGAALVGLLFVAVSISPERTLGTEAPLERRAAAASAYTALLNPFFVSLYALIPHLYLGYVVLFLSLSGLSTVLWVARTLWHHPARWQTILRRAWFVLGGLGLYGYELSLAVWLIRSPTDPVPAYFLAGLLGASYGIGLLRAWQLLGGRRYGPGSWFDHFLMPEAKKATSSMDKPDASHQGREN